MDSMEDMVAAVREHARKNYNDGGWDTIVECYDDADIEREIIEGKATTTEEAIAYIGKGCKIYDDYRKDIQATAF
jgi:hypothetical protein